MRCDRSRATWRLAALALALLVGASLADAQIGKGAPVGATAPKAAADEPKVLRYASLKADRVQLRQGPGREHPVAWVIQRTGLPVEVIGEFEAWCQVRDAAGTVGWVYASLLSGRRTALVLPWEVKSDQTQPPLATLRDDDDEQARAVVQVEAGALANIISCENAWCRVSIDNHRGYIEQAKLWGTYPNETIR
ncbi:MAG: SH3 domain-containing protein [Hyphomicrobiaceae bacterium]|nr:SH3 domain-containing protein [Hyphomicrobiaceae bacterium]